MNEKREFLSADNPPFNLSDATLIEFEGLIYGLTPEKYAVNGKRKSVEWLARNAIDAILNNTSNPYLRCPECIRGTQPSLFSDD